MSLPSSRIGPFVVGRQIGRGGVGVVHAALPQPRLVGPEERLSGQPPAAAPEVALKLLPADLAQDRDFRSRFAREARTLARLDSPHVLPVRAYGEEGGRLYLASDLVPDGDLERMLRTHGTPPVDLALRLVSQAALGLADAHDAGLVHGGVKPANVMLRRVDEEFQACLTDFGTAHGAAGPLQPGNARWAAPELHTGAEPSVASDLYSLGCVLWTALTGSAPYDAPTEFQLASAHLGSAPRQLAGGSPLVLELNRVLTKVLDKDPSRRYTSARQLADALARARSLAGAREAPLVPAPPVGGPPVVVPVPSRPRRWRSALVGVAALVLGIVGTLAIVEGDAVGTAPAALSGGDREDEPVLNSEARAVTSIADGFVDVLLVDQENARCIAGRWVEEMGLGRLIAAGFLDSDLGYRDHDLEAVDPAIKQSLEQATQVCLS
ncbi:serine/threonine-protein kinase [Nocardioides campestrisoli]|uniref:serine/threonine-protein kinase n=1 Tax=Nocardioides campestrisoli TaxID=2736757 RepID=UPI00163D56CE|nr:serine/threonine-protein kinase [Nocardioides campestrisoli]